MELELFGKAGEKVRVEAGDVVVMLAWVSHAITGNSDDVLVVGGYPKLLYAEMLRKGTLPNNIRVSEFFLGAGAWLDLDAVQQSYVSANYTHALDMLLARRPNVLAQFVADDGTAFSLSCNPDISADLFALRDEGTIDFIATAETNPELPFLRGDGVVLDHDAFEVVLDPVEPFELYSARSILHHMPSGCTSRA